MKINDVDIDETFAEGFSMYASRILITAETLKLAQTASSAKTTRFLPSHPLLKQNLGLSLIT